VKNIFALGDVVSLNRQFTHLANHEGRGIIQSLLVPFWKSRIKPANVPSVLYDREVEFARTGLTSEKAIENYGEDAIIVDRMDFSTNDRSRTEAETTGYVRIIAKRLSLQII
jgi:pyruvate/2-oxoglutarate dehydrogenase complex dihydrolipoamide dehydrogenase (E3) component